MENLLFFISWTGWTKEDWKEFLYKFTPFYWMSKTGWTEEEWMECISDCGKGFVLGLLLLLALYLVFSSGLAV